MEPPTIFVKPRAPEASALASSMHPYSPDILPVMFGPNITGKWMARGPEWSTHESSGACLAYDSGVSAGGGHATAATTAALDVSANRSSSTYGSASTVQPASARVFPCIKT